MRDGVWDRVSRSVRKTNHNNSISRLFGASHRHLTTFRSGLGLRSIRSQRSNRYRLAVKIRQSTVAQRRPESVESKCGAVTLG